MNDEARNKWLAKIERRATRWRQLLIETGADKIGETRVQLLIWRSGRGVNSVVIDTYAHIGSTPLALSEALWRLSESFEDVMASGECRVNIPAPIPPSLGRTIHPGIDTAGLFIWDGFFNAQEDTWSGLLWECWLWQLQHRPPLIKNDDELRRAIEKYHALYSRAQP